MSECEEELDNFVLHTHLCEPQNKNNRFDRCCCDPTTCYRSDFSYLKNTHQHTRTQTHNITYK